jgi:hypothetical protein
MLPHQGEALGVIDQRREIDQIRCGHGGKRSFDGGELPSCSYHPSTFPARSSFLPITTPDPVKSHSDFNFKRASARELRERVAAGVHEGIPDTVGRSASPSG